MLTRYPTLAATRAHFQWDIPAHYNIGVDVCDRPARAMPDAPAIIDVAPDGSAVTYSFADLRALSNRLAHALTSHVGSGDRVGVLLPQQVETAAAHIAVLKMAAISIPLFTLFGPDALRHRLADSAARVVITNDAGAKTLMAIRADLPDLDLIVSTGQHGDVNFADYIAPHSTRYKPKDTLRDDPAVLIYTSGTTGPPKGALHGHRVLLGHLPGVEMSHDFFPQPDDLIWTPADWAWIGGLFDVLLPALHHGVPVLACRFRKFTAEAAFDLMTRFPVRNAFLPPTALKMMRQMPSPPRLSLRSVASGGETLGASLLDWGRDTFGCTINEFYGQTECNMIVSSCAALASAESGVMGFAVPGHDVAVIAADGRICAVEEEGDIAVATPDPVMFLRYWNAPAATADKFRGAWLITGDRGMTTASGAIRFVGRDDDVISSSGYRIGPAEIEDCLLTHPSVHMAGVVGQPDPLRGSIVAAYIQLVPDARPTEELAQEITQHVRDRLAAYEAPRALYFIDEMPLTTTGKIIRAALRDLLPVV